VVIRVKKVMKRVKKGDAPKGGDKGKKGDAPKADAGKKEPKKPKA